MATGALDAGEIGGGGGAPKVVPPPGAACRNRGGGFAALRDPLRPAFHRGRALARAQRATRRRPPRGFLGGVLQAVERLVDAVPRPAARRGAPTRPARPAVEHVDAVDVLDRGEAVGDHEGRLPSIRVWMPCWTSARSRCRWSSWPRRAPGCRRRGRAPGRRRAADAAPRRSSCPARAPRSRSPRGARCQEAVGHGRPRRGPLDVRGVYDLAPEGDVLRDAAAEEEDVLEHHGDAAAQLPPGASSRRSTPSMRMRAAGDVVESGEELDEASSCRRPWRPRRRPARPARRVNETSRSTQSSPPIGEVHPVELDENPRPRRRRRRAGCGVGHGPRGVDAPRARCRAAGRCARSWPSTTASPSTSPTGRAAA